MARNAEAGLQASIVSYVRRITDPKRLKIFHIPNGELRDRATAAKLKWMGVLAGIPDLALIKVVSGQSAEWAFWEVKLPGSPPLSGNQLEIETWCVDNGVRHRVVRSIDDARASLKAWGVVTKEAAA